MTDALFVGVDSGGTRTNVELLVASGTGDAKLPAYEVGDSLSGTLEHDMIPTVLRRIFAPLQARIEEAAVTAPIYIWVSAAGFSPWTHEIYISALEDLRQTVHDGAVRAIGVGNDAVSLLLGSRADGVIIAGTGSNVLLKARDDALHQSGGRDWVASDYGSGLWIGLRSIRQAYRDFESGVDSVLLQRFHQVYGVKHGHDDALIAKMRDLAITDQNMKREIARFTESVCGAAERGDPDAQNIVKAEAEDLADVTAVSIRRIFSLEELGQGLSLVQCGSILDNDFYRSSFEAQLEMRLLSGLKHKSEIEWRRMVTGASMALQLARDIAHSPHDLLRTDKAFRPAVVAS